MSTPQPYWQRQDPASPLFPDLIWSKPENRAFAGKLAIIGGNLHSFAAPAEAFSAAETAGIGTARVLLPEPLRKLTGFLDRVEYAPGNPSGSFSQRSLSDWLDLALWADCVLLTGDLGRNSETAIVFESFVAKYSGQLVITKDACNYALHVAPMVAKRPNTTLVLSLGQLQKYATRLGTTTPITLGMGLVRLCEALHQLTLLHTTHLVTKYDDTLCVAAAGKVSTTPTADNETVWSVATAARAATWWAQNPERPYQALTTALCP